MPSVLWVLVPCGSSGQVPRPGGKWVYWPAQEQQSCLFSSVVSSVLYGAPVRLSEVGLVGGFLVFFGHITWRVVLSAWQLLLDSALSWLPEEISANQPPFRGSWRRSQCLVRGTTSALLLQGTSWLQSSSAAQCSSAPGSRDEEHAGCCALGCSAAPPLLRPAPPPAAPPPAAPWGPPPRPLRCAPSAAPRFTCWQRRAGCKKEPLTAPSEVFKPRSVECRVWKNRLPSP